MKKLHITILALVVCTVISSAALLMINNANDPPSNVVVDNACNRDILRPLYDPSPEPTETTGSLLDYIVKIGHDSPLCRIVSCQTCFGGEQKGSTNTFDESLSNVVVNYNIESGKTTYYDLYTGEEVDIDL